MNTILIRADANSEIGTGHVMRMIGLAQGIIRAGGEAYLVTYECPPTLIDRIISAGIQWRSGEKYLMGSITDARNTKKIAQQVNADWLVTDGYHFDLAYQLEVKEAGLKLACVCLLYTSPSPRDA